MKIALIGYGKMGKAIEIEAIKRGHTILTKVDKKEDLPKIADADCAIEFTIPDACEENILFAVEHNIPIVVGTTGWYGQYETIKQAVIANNGAMLSATNFSIGVNILFKINDYLSKVMNKFDEYQPEMEEIHHLQKLDHPSGTAITLANSIVQNMDKITRYDGYLEGDIFSISNNCLSILSKRAVEVPGTHTINYVSEIDEITISHRAKNRTGFAVGAVIAAEWLIDKRGVYTMSDVLGI